VKNFNGESRPLGRMDAESWIEIYGDVPKSDHFATEADKHEAAMSLNRPMAVPGPYNRSIRGRAAKRWRDKMEQGRVPNTARNFNLSKTVPLVNMPVATQSHIERYVQRALAAGYSVTELKQNPETGVWYVKLCRDDICTYQVIMGPSGTMSGGTRRRRNRRRGTKRRR